MRAGLGQSRGREARQKEGRSEKEEHLTLCLAACRTQLIPMLRQRIPGRATCVNKRIESVLVTLSSVLSSRFSLLLFLYFSPTNSSSLSLPPSLSLCRPRRFPFRLPASILTPTRSSPQSSIRTTPLSQLRSLSFSASRYVNRPVSVTNSVISSQAVTCNTHVHILRGLFLIRRACDRLCV